MDSGMDTSSEAAGARKRRRTASPELPPGNSKRRSDREEPWLEDGNVVLVSIEGKQFRVHRGVLASNSPIFRDVFALGQADGPTLDGCSVVHLSDTAQDLRHVLKALYDRGYFGFEGPQPFDIVAAAARLGKKYEIKPLLRQAMSLLTKAFPASLGEYDRYYMGPDPGYTHIILNSRSLFLETLALSEELDMPFIRPVAFAACNRFCLLDEILEGVTMQSRHFALSARDLNICLRGRQKLLQSSLVTLKWISDVPCPLAGCQIIRHNLMKYCIEKSPCGLPLCSFSAVMRMAPGLCQSCVEQAKPLHEQGRAKVWQHLPEMFKLPGWTELETLRANYVV